MAEKTELLEADEKVVEIELERLRGFENHPFKVRADSQMIAEVLYTKKATISAYEHDKIDIKISVLKELADILDTSVAYLTGETEINIDMGTMKILELLSQIDNQDIRNAAVNQIKVLLELNEKIKI